MTAFRRGRCSQIRVLCKLADPIGRILCARGDLRFGPFRLLSAPGEAMRFLVWNSEMQKYECSDCRWKQALNPESNDPAERLEHEFAAHNCEEHQRKAAA